MGLLINVLIPWGLASTLTPLGLLIAMAAFMLKGSILAVVVGFFESIMAKSRLFNLRTLFILAFSLAFLTIAFELLI